MAGKRLSEIINGERIVSMVFLGAGSVLLIATEKEIYQVKPPNYDSVKLCLFEEGQRWTDQ